MYWVELNSQGVQEECDDVSQDASLRWGRRWGGSGAEEEINYDKGCQQGYRLLLLVGTWHTFQQILHH